MKVYKVKVNGKVYEVELEAVSENSEKISAPTAAAAPAPAAATSGEGEALPSPIQGTVLKVNVSAGQSVKAGDVVMVIEAMKLENDIVAPKDGVVKEVKVSKGQTVNSKDTLLILG